MSESVSENVKDAAITIRSAALADVEAILTISNWAAAHTPANFAIEPEKLEDWQASWRATHERFGWLVAEAGGQVVGFAKSSPWKGRCAYAFAVEVSVYVADGWHRRGIGRALYGRLLPSLATAGFRTILAGITLPNEASVALHESFGFRQVALFERIGWKFERWHDVGYWQMWVE